MVHQFVHDEGGTSHIAAVLHKGDEKIQYQDVGKEDDDASHTADDTIDQEAA